MTFDRAEGEESSSSLSFLIPFFSLPAHSPTDQQSRRNNVDSPDVPLPPPGHAVEDQCRDLAPLADPRAVAAEEPPAGAARAVPGPRQVLEVRRGRQLDALRLKVRDLAQRDRVPEAVLERVVDARERDGAGAVVVVLFVVGLVLFFSDEGTEN